MQTHHHLSTKIYPYLQIFAKKKKKNKVRFNLSILAFIAKLKLKLTKFLMILGLMIFSFIWIVWLSGHKYVSQMLIAYAIWILEGVFSTFRSFSKIFDMCVVGWSGCILLNKFEWQHFTTDFHFWIWDGGACEFIGGSLFPNTECIESLTFDVNEPRTLLCCASSY